MKRIMAPAGLALALSGCSATIESQRVSADTWAPSGTAVKGIIHYQPALMKVTHEFTVRVDKDGKVLGTAAAGTCQPATQKEEIQVLPDFSRPIALLNHPAALANSKFSATLNNGLLQSVNSETTSVAADLLSAASGAVEVAIAAAPTKPGVDQCNSSPQVTKVARVEVTPP